MSLLPKNYLQLFSFHFSDNFTPFNRIVQPIDILHDLILYSWWCILSFQTVYTCVTLPMISQTRTMNNKTKEHKQKSSKSEVQIKPQVERRSSHLSRASRRYQRRYQSAPITFSSQFLHNWYKVPSCQAQKIMIYKVSSVNWQCWKTQVLSS